MIQAYRFSADGPSIEVPLASSGSTLPGTLMIQPGNYLYQGVPLDMTAPGPYVLNCPTANGTHRIVKGDLYEAMAGFCWWTQFGNLNDGANSDALVAQVIDGNYLSMLCDKTCKWIKYVLTHASNGYTARLVRVLPNDNPLSTYDDGHVMLEVLIDESWILFDPSFDRYWGWGGLSLAAVIDAGVGNCAEVRLARTEMSHYTNPSTSLPNHRYLTTFRCLLDNPVRKAAWTARTLFLPAIEDAAGNVYCYLPAGYNRPSIPPSWNVLSKASWLAMFYP